MEAATSYPTPPASLRLAASTGSFLPDLSPHVGDSSGEQSIETPSPPQLARSWAPKTADSPSPAVRVRSQSGDFVSSGNRGFSMPKSTRTEVCWPPAAPAFNKRRRTRVNSATTSSSMRSLRGTGFPYRNSAALLDADAAWSSAGGSDGFRDDNSSESGDVDLDLTLAWEEQRAHVGIDMTNQPTHDSERSLAAPAVIRSSHSWERGAETDYGAGWSFQPTAPLSIDTEHAEASEGRNRQHSWHGLLGVLKSPTWSTSAGSSEPSRRGSRVESSWGRTTTAATTPQSPIFSPSAQGKQPEMPAHQPVMDENRQQQIGSFPSRLISAFRDSMLSSQSAGQAASAQNGLGIRMGTPPSSPVPELSISSPDGRTESHIRWANSPAKMPRTFRPKHLLLASKAKTQVQTESSKTGYRPMRLNEAQGSYLPSSPVSPVVSPRPGSPASVASSRSASPQPQQPWTEPLEWYNERSPAEWLFLLGWICGPWLWWIGAFSLRSDDGELFGTRVASSRSASPQPQQPWTEPLPWYDERSPAEWLFLLGWICGPWLWWIGAFSLRSDDGELFGTRGQICRCRQECLCYALKRRELRLAGVPDSGRGTLMDAVIAQRTRGLHHAGADGWVKANRAAAGVSSVAIAAVFGVALAAIIRAW